MSTIDELKTEIRKIIRNKKAEVPFEEKLERSVILIEQVEKLPVFMDADSVMLFWSMSDEVQTPDFILKWYLKKKIILPSVDGTNLRLKVFTGINSMKSGESFGIPEPDGEDFLYPEQIGLIIVPGVAFDRNNNRMGRGKAYYDKLLKNLDAYKLGVCFNFQLLENVPVDEFDIKMDQVLVC